MIPTPFLFFHRMNAMLSQRELAKRAGVSAATVFRLEHGYRGHQSTIRKLAQALQVKPASLVGASTPAA